MAESSDSQLDLAFDFVQHTSANIFLTGKAGTGKTTFLRSLNNVLPKRMIVVAPTGVAAINAGGVTIHSFFQLPFGPFLPVRGGGSGQQDLRQAAAFRKFSREKVNIIRSLDLLVIDEISMVRADLLDGIDDVLRKYKNRNKPFGGVQLLMIGDLQQLAPVAKEEEWKMIRQYYDSVYFFSSRALKQTEFITIELKHIYRQTDQYFIDILNKVRDNQIDEPVIKELNKRYIPGFSEHIPEGYITLTTHNAQAQAINESKLKQLTGHAKHFKARVQGDFPEYSFPTDMDLSLKEGAQVMFLRNDSSREKLYFNGKIGCITRFEDEIILVQCEGEEDEIPVEPVQWENTKYSLDEETKEIRGNVVGAFTQYPLKLAWAITIHKSQGLTFEKAIIDANAAFASGQVYVGLSRCRSLEGLVLNTPLSAKNIISDPAIAGFTSEVEKHVPGKDLLEKLAREYQQQMVMELFDFSATRNRLLYCSKLAGEHASELAGDITGDFQKLGHRFRSEIFEVNEKFRTQLQSFLIHPGSLESNDGLQDRIKKATVYFSEKLQGIRDEACAGVSIETDNSAVGKTMREAWDKLLTETLIKEDCMKACKHGFTVHGFLKARSEAMIEAPERKQAKKQEETIPSSITHPALFALLKAWRMKKSDELDLPPYMILHQKPLLKIISMLPGSLNALQSIKGFGRRKAEQFGEEIIAIIQTYCKAHAIEIPVNEDLPVKKARRAKPNSKLVSFELFKTGRSMPQIAGDRGMALSTIEGHLAHFVGTGEIRIDQLVSKNKTEAIQSYFNNSGNRSLARAKEALGNAVSYSDLRFVLKHIEFLALK